MHFLYTLFIALANNLDNIGVRIAYSIRGIKISTLINLWISLITLIISSLAAFSGKLISGLFNKEISSVLSMLLLVAIGLWIILEQYVKKYTVSSEINDLEENKTSVYAVLKNPEHADADNSKSIDYKEATILGIALSINNIGGGISAGMIGLNSIFVGILSALISFLALWAGNYISEFFNKWNLGNKATYIAGIALIAIGIRQIL